MKRILIFIGAIICTSLYFVNAAEEAEVLSQEKTEDIKKGEEEKSPKVSGEAKEEKALKEEDNLIKDLTAAALIEDLHKSEVEKKEEEPKNVESASSEIVPEVSGPLQKGASNKAENLQGKDILDALDDEDLNIETDDLESLIDDKKEFDI